MTPDPNDKLLLDHRYDDIQEYDNPLPRWWVVLFWVTIVFSVLYGLNVPGIGTGKGRVANYEAEMAAARARQQEAAARAPVVQDTDESLMQAAHDPRILALGHEVFAGTCAACHLEDGGGNIGPNLTDRYWIHGGRPTEVLHTIRTGVVDKGMPAWSEALPPEKVRAAAVYVLTLRGTHPKNPKAPQGTEIEGPGEESSEHAAGGHETH